MDDVVQTGSRTTDIFQVVKEVVSYNVPKINIESFVYS